MKEFNCKSCNKTWFVKPDMADEVSGCPFCLKELPKPRTVVVDSFETAVLKVIVDYGVEIVSDRRKFLSYLADLAADYRKEIRILSNYCDSKVFMQFYELSTQKLDDAKIKIRQIKQHLVDDEGAAESWAIRICECFICAIREDYSSENVELPAGDTDKGEKDTKSKKIASATKETKKPVAAQVNARSTRSYATRVQDDVDSVIRSIKKLYAASGKFSYSNARDYRDISTGTLIIPKGYTKMAANAIEGLSIKHIYFPSTMHDIPQRVFTATLQHIYVESGNPRYVSSADGEKIIDLCTNSIIYEVRKRRCS